MTPPRPLDEQMIRACEAMLRYALASGFTVPESVILVVDRAARRDEEPPPLPQIIRAHAELVRIVAPATPRTILLLFEGKQARLPMLGPVRLVRQMLVAVLILLTSFVLLATSSHINLTSGDIFHSDGMPLLVNELFFLAAGGLGAAFSALFTAYRYIADGTYDPKFESTYWLRFILGLIAGLLLPALIPLGEGAEGAALTKPLLALLGGFSASVLYRILERMVGAVESLVRTDSRELRTAQREVAVARASEQVGQDRIGLIGELRRVEQQARTGGDPAQVADSLQRMVDTLLPSSPMEPVEDGSPPRPAPQGGPVRVVNP